MRAPNLFLLALVGVCLLTFTCATVVDDHDLLARNTDLIHGCDDDNDDDACSWKCSQVCHETSPSHPECDNHKPQFNCPRVLPGGTSVAGTLTAITVVATEVETSFLSCARGSRYIKVTCPLALPQGSKVLGDLTVTGEIIADSAEISGTITSATIVNSGTVYSSGVATNTISCNGATSIAFTCPVSLPSGSSVSGNLAVTGGLQVGGLITANGGVNSPTAGISAASLTSTGALTAGTSTLGSTSVCAVPGQTFTAACGASLGPGTTVNGDLGVANGVTSATVDTGTLTASSITTTSLIVNGQPCVCSGPLGSLAYGYVYKTGPVTVVPIEGSIVFTTNGLLSGITHAPGAAEVVVINAGVYEVTFSVSGTQPNQFALFVNGVVVPGSIYGSGAGTQQNTGQVIVQLSAADVLTVVNHSSAAAVDIDNTIGGTQNVAGASLLIKQLA